MNFRGKEISKKMLVFGIIGILFATFAVASLVSYISNSLTANVNIASPLVLQGFTGTENNIGNIDSVIGSVPVGIVPPQTINMNIVGGEIATYTMRIVNRGTSAINGKVNITINATTPFTTNFDEFDVVGIRDYSGGVWEPTNDVTTCTGAGLYWSGTECWADFKPLLVGLGGSNLVVLNTPSGLPFPAGSTYAQFLLRANLLIAPSDYSASVQIVP